VPELMKRALMVVVFVLGDLVKVPALLRVLVATPKLKMVSSLVTVKVAPAALLKVAPSSKPRLAVPPQLAVPALVRVRASRAKLELPPRVSVAPTATVVEPSPAMVAPPFQVSWV